MRQFILVRHVLYAIGHFVRMQPTCCSLLTLLRCLCRWACWHFLLVRSTPGLWLARLSVAAAP